LQVESARALAAALDSGRLSMREHEAACARIEALIHPDRRPVSVPPRAGDELAEIVARRAVHLFGPAMPLLPMPPQAQVLVIAPRLGSVVAVEEEVGMADHGFLAAAFAAHTKRAQVVPVALDPTAAETEAALGAVRAAGRVVVFTFNARGLAGQRALVTRIAAEALDRTVFVHLRNPFDHGLLPDTAVGLTPFGYRRPQIRAAVDVVFGALAPTGILPAPIR
jgi:beta-N-acetylhexosaminidase